MIIKVLKWAPQRVPSHNKQKKDKWHQSLMSGTSLGGKISLNMSIIFLSCSLSHAVTLQSQRCKDWFATATLLDRLLEKSTQSSQVLFISFTVESHLTPINLSPSTNRQALSSTVSRRLSAVLQRILESRARAEERANYYLSIELSKNKYYSKLRNLSSSSLGASDGVSITRSSSPSNLIEAVSARSSS